MTYTVTVFDDDWNTGLTGQLPQPLLFYNLTITITLLAHHSTMLGKKSCCFVFININLSKKMFQQSWQETEHMLNTWASAWRQMIHHVCGVITVARGWYLTVCGLIWSEPEGVQLIREHLPLNDPCKSIMPSELWQELKNSHLHVNVCQDNICLCLIIAKRGKWVVNRSNHQF